LGLHFYKRPFTHICIPFIIGIAIVLIYGAFSNSLILLGSLIIGCVYFWLFIGIQYGVFGYFLAYCLSFLLGSFVATVYIEGQTSIFQTGYKTGGILQGELIEVSTGKNLWNKAILNVNTIYAKDKTHHTNELILLYLSRELTYLQKGDEILVGAEVTKIKNKNNPGEFNAEYYWKSRGIETMAFVSPSEMTWVDSKSPSLLSSFFSYFSNYLNSALTDNLSGSDLAIAQALVLGDKSLLESDVKNAFTNTGAMHVLAVSGMHVGLILYLFLALFGFFPSFLSKKQATILIVLILWIYAIITGLSASVIRAVFMFTILALSQISSKQNDSLNTLFFSAFILLILNPFYLLDVGFQLSYLAMIGIFLFYPKIEKLIDIKPYIFKKLWQGTAIGFAAQLMTVGISLFYFHQFPNYFILSNLGLMFLSSLIMGLAIFLFLVKNIPVLSNFIGILLGGSVYIMYWIIQKIEEIPGAVAYGYLLPFWMVILLGLLFIILILYSKSKKQLIIGYLFYFSLLLLIVFNRYRSLSSSELCVFNHNQFVATVKIRNKIYCFYKSRPDQVDKLKVLVESYSKLNPGEIIYFDINRKKITLLVKNKRFEIADQGGLIHLSIDKRKYDVLFKQNESINSKILMPWIHEGEGHLLMGGAFISKI